QPPADLSERVAGERGADDRQGNSAERDDRRVAEVHPDVRAGPGALEGSERRRRRQADLVPVPVRLAAEGRRGHEEERENRGDREEAETSAQGPRAADAEPPPPRGGGDCNRRARHASFRVRARIWSSPITSTMPTSITPTAAA